MSSVIVPDHGWRFKLLNQNPDHVDEDDYVDLVEIHATHIITQEREKTHFNAKKNPQAQSYSNKANFNTVFVKLIGIYE